MATKSEEQVIEDYRKQGFFYVHSGSPDFLFYKIKENVKNPKVEDIDINSIEFIEVKFNGDILNHEQQIWKHILQKLGLNYKLINIPPKQSFGVN